MRWICPKVNLRTMVLLRALWFLPTLPLPGSGIPPRNGFCWITTISLKGVTEIDIKQKLNFQDRREARKYVTQMLKAGFIKHTVNKTTFSEQCYYTFCDDKFLAGSKHNFILIQAGYECNGTERWTGPLASISLFSVSCLDKGLYFGLEIFLYPLLFPK